MPREKGLETGIVSSSSATLHYLQRPGKVWGKKESKQTFCVLDLFVVLQMGGDRAQGINIPPDFQTHFHCSLPPNPSALEPQHYNSNKRYGPYSRIPLAMSLSNCQTLKNHFGSWTLKFCFHFHLEKHVHLHPGDKAEQKFH